MFQTVALRGDPAGSNVLMASGTARSSGSMDLGSWVYYSEVPGLPSAYDIRYYDLVVPAAAQSFYRTVSIVLTGVGNQGSRDMIEMEIDGVIQADVWDFVITTVPTSSIQFDNISWNQTPAITETMITYVHPGYTIPSYLGTPPNPATKLLVNNSPDSPFSYASASMAGSTLVTLTTPVTATDPIWTLHWWRSIYRPGLEIRKNGVRFYIDQFTGGTTLPENYSFAYARNS